MSDAEYTPPEKTSLVPHIVVGAVLVILVAVGIFIMTSEEEPAPPKPVAIPEPVIEQPVEEEPQPEPEPVFVEPEPIVTPEPLPEPEPEPLDISDAAIKTALITLSELPVLAEALVDDDLLRRFVVFTTNLADEELAENHQFLNAPTAPFRVYRQAGKEWIDAASFKRYSPYVEALDSIEVANLVSLYNEYKPAITEFYLEIGDPDDSFDDILTAAIDHLLDTPEIPVPVEVYSDSVMYKYRNERVENLSAAQKQLLRTGPENMRQIKSKLREIKAFINR